MFARPLDLSAMLKASDISPAVQQHLARVYAALAAGLLVAAFGTVAQMFLRLPQLLLTLGVLGMMVWNVASVNGRDLQKRLWIFGGFCLLKGMALGGFVESILYYDPTILVVAFLYTTAAFLCFSGFALLTKRRSQLYLGAILSSIASWMLLGSLLNLFFRTTLMNDVSLYGGLVLFLGYVVYDTQIIVEKAAAAGAGADVVGHAFSLFVDFIALFTRIAIILLRNSERKNNNSRRNNHHRS